MKSVPAILRIRRDIRAYLARQLRRSSLQPPFRAAVSILQESAQLFFCPTQSPKNGAFVDTALLGNLQDGFVFRDAGGTAAVYNDLLNSYDYTLPDGNVLTISSNVYLEESEYTVGKTQE